MTGLLRQVYRPVAARCALLYFLIDALNALDRMYHFSMANFVLALKQGTCELFILTALHARPGADCGRALRQAWMQLPLCMRSRLP